MQGPPISLEVLEETDVVWAAWKVDLTVCAPRIEVLVLSNAWPPFAISTFPTGLTTATVEVAVPPDSVVVARTVTVTMEVTSSTACRQANPLFASASRGKMSDVPSSTTGLEAMGKKKFANAMAATES